MGDADLGGVIARRPATLTNLTDGDWQRLGDLWSSGAYETEFNSGFLNGRAFLAAPDALNGRVPRIIEWTGARRSLGDEALPADLRIDHVYLVSCKYLSRILHNPSPARLVEGLLTTAPVDDLRDWYLRTAPDEYQRLYEACLAQIDGGSLPMLASQLTSRQRHQVADSLKDGWPGGAADEYGRLCSAVADATARMWSANLPARGPEPALWRLLRIAATPYFVLGASPGGSMRLRIDTPWDWRQTYRLNRLTIEAQPGGQPRVSWTAACEVRSSGDERLVRGHIEIRWSHGRFAQPPEAKVYLDSPHETVPGYQQL